MTVSIQYAFERKDIEGRWHLIETCENVYYNLYHFSDLNQKQIYNQDLTVKMREPNKKVFRELSSLGGNASRHKILYHIDIYKIDNYDFNPLTKYYIKDILLEHYTFGYNQFDEIVRDLEYFDDLGIKYYKDLIKGSVDYFSSKEKMVKLNPEGDFRKNLYSIVSNHEYLELMETEFSECSLENLRMIAFYNS